MMAAALTHLDSSSLNLSVKASMNEDLHSVIDPIFRLLGLWTD